MVWLLVFLRVYIKTWCILGDTQSEDRKSFKPPFLLPRVSSRMSILLRRWTTQFLGLEGGLEEDELDPEVLEEVEDLEGKRKLLVGRKCSKCAANKHVIQ